MKNTLRVLLAGSALMFGISVPCSADQVQGLVESIDPSNNTIRIKDPVSGDKKTVRVHPKVISDVKKGSVVKATYGPGSDDADTVEVLLPKN